MGKASFAGNDDNPIGVTYSTARGPVLRSDRSEIARVFFEKGKGAERHSHPEEQTFYVVAGRLRVSLGEEGSAETYEVAAGEGSFHPSNVPHQVTALEDTSCVSFKNLIDPSKYDPTGKLA